ncbi:MAG: amino acid--tRNA ligase-related protein, partial [Patescibacteria group bacterium]
MNRIYIKELKNKIGEEVKIAGWVDVRRDHGKLIFIDLRDMSGKVQMVALPNHKEAHETASKLRSEWVVEIIGKVNKRPEKMVNKDEPLGEVEVEIIEVKILNEAITPVFEINNEGLEVNEETRLTNRYLDLRRNRMQKNLRMRHEVIRFFRNYLSDKNFAEIETPLLTKSTPEGARDFVVPSRLYNGKFYALPQSPQQYKQLLMAAGMERYFQIAKCLRDEDTRGDRQPEFTQLDLEMSFAEQKDVMNLIEEMLIATVKKLYPQKKIQQI